MAATSKKRQAHTLAADPAQSAQSAGLRYVSDSRRGIQRKRAGTGFQYIGTDGNRVTDEATLERIRSLAIPPAYTDVWICPSPRGHLQATGRDARGRKQYRYHPRWREVRDETKYARMLEFSAALPRIRTRVEADLRRPGLPREKVLAAVIRLLEYTAIRVGNDEYARTNNSYGLTTLQDDHVTIRGAKVRFQFTGKSGKTHEVHLTDRRLATIVQRCQALPGEDLFQYVDGDGEQQTITSGDVNDYLKEISGEDYTAKDFRTWCGTMEAVNALLEAGYAGTEAIRKQIKLAVIDRVAEQLNNTRAVCRKYYIHPAVFEIYDAGILAEELGRPSATTDGLHPDERRVERLLRRYEERRAAKGRKKAS